MTGATLDPRTLVATVAWLRVKADAEPSQARAASCLRLASRPEAGHLRADYARGLLDLFLPEAFRSHAPDARSDS